ncbi:clindamycin resistance transfer factor BtgA [Dysgonomonas sp. Marseille-P4677]|uniref:BfmA/BtgA family mobilization protein n=1 Tax=Dysgonomonas sp. Marseille-P4677 TaxID=2364790 RepID=UPI0019144163|nr:BfmA/BtgA family mobilization protein [Dysgonomonas sp. Marseille-P4677]MBK5722010.1 clindamycin resistance transfer factor BtgA [Dysgonomonas sp. Marseille-P4677]
MNNRYRKTIFTTIGIDNETDKLIEKLSKRYLLKKGEIVKLAFQYMDKASINPSEAPESTKAELRKINKRQDDLIRFIRHYEEEQLNPMIRTSNSIATRFDNIVKSMEDVIISRLQANQEGQNNLLKMLSEKFTGHADAINNQAKLISAIQKAQQKDNKKLLQLIGLYSELATVGLMDGKRKENLKAEIAKLINEQ